MRNRTGLLIAILLLTMGASISSYAHDSVSSGISAPVPAWKGTSLENFLGKWEINSTFLDFENPAIQHVEKASYVVRPDRELARGNGWVVGIWAGSRTDGSAPFNVRFHHRAANPGQTELQMVEFGDWGPNAWPVLPRTGTDRGNGRIDWKGTFMGRPFVEIWQAQGDRISFKTLVPDENGVPIAWGEGRRRH
jgi:hypothetical protein